MKNFLLLAALGISSWAFSQTLYEEGFECFTAGDYVSDSPVWNTWTNGQEGSTGDAQISDEQAHTGTNSLHIYAASPAGGPMDVVMLAGLDEGVYEASMWMYIPDGSSAYYNVQEDLIPGVGWAFEATFAFTGDMQVVMDGEVVATGTVPLDTWFQVSHLIDMDNDVVTLSIDGTEAGSWTFDSPFGGVNFYGMGDGTTVGNYFVDDIAVFDPAAPQSNTVVDIIFNSCDHTLLEAAVIEAGLVEALSGEGPFTVFAPNDAAVVALTEALEITADSLLGLPNLGEILQYHVVGASAYAADLSDGQMITTLLGEDVTVSITAEGVMINDAMVIVADIEADNGVVHVIDAVLLPASATAVNEAEQLAVMVYPNPASAFINLQGQPNEALIRIHALNGQLVYQQQVNNMNRGELIEFNLNNGIYFLEVTADGKRSTQRLVVSQ